MGPFYWYLSPLFARRHRVWTSKNGHTNLRLRLVSIQYERTTHRKNCMSKNIACKITWISAYYCPSSDFSKSSSVAPAKSPNPPPATKKDGASKNSGKILCLKRLSGGELEQSTRSPTRQKKVHRSLEIYSKWENFFHRNPTFLFFLLSSSLPPKPFRQLKMADEVYDGAIGIDLGEF